jgi:hypothetical protein
MYIGPIDSNVNCQNTFCSAHPDGYRTGPTLCKETRKVVKSKTKSTGNGEKIPGKSHDPEIRPKSRLKISTVRLIFGNFIPRSVFPNRNPAYTEKPAG